jgi:hypothetical protein
MIDLTGWSEIWTGPSLRKNRRMIDFTWPSQKPVSIQDKT